jgi:hypothetical protein
VPAGYGSLGIGGRQHGTHRVSWALANGEWPKGMVLHRCGNPGCVRPDHLYVGDAKQNKADERQHGRQPLGERHANAKLADWRVAEIRRRYAAGELGADLAAEFGVSHAQVSNMVSGRQRGGGDLRAQHATARRTSLCERCGDPVVREPRRRKARFCPACRVARQRMSETRACPVCGTEFYRPPSAKATTCSYTCMGALRTRQSATT